MKIVWICHFSDDKVQTRLRPWKKVSQFAPWISKTVPTFEARDDIELHIIAPHEYISGLKEYEQDGVHYHFFNPHMPILGRHWPAVFRWDILTNFRHNKKVVGKLVDQISPDVIHLQGAENPYYSATILPLIGKYPIVVNLQRINKKFLTNPDTANTQRANIEKEIWDRAENFTIRTKTMKFDFLSYKHTANMFWVNYAMDGLEPIKSEKIYDLVYFARVCKEKGIEDLLEAFAIVVSSIPSAKLCIVGGTNESYKSLLVKRANLLMINTNLIWMGQLPQQSDVHMVASKAKVSVLPTHNDIISGTIIESMQLGLPVVSYKTGSIPELNEEKENVLLVDRGDIQGLARNIIRLLTDEELCSTMSQRGIDCIRTKYSSQNVLQQHLDCYREVIADFHKDKRQNINHREH